MEINKVSNNMEYWEFLFKIRQDIGQLGMAVSFHPLTDKIHHVREKSNLNLRSGTPFTVSFLLDFFCFFYDFVNAFPTGFQKDFKIRSLKF